MNILTTSRLFFVLACSSLLLSCTRPVENTVSLSLDIPTLQQKIGSLSSCPLQHIVVNVTGPGINFPILWNWDAKGPGNIQLPIPQSIEIDVPSGPNRLIQYLGVCADTSNGYALRFSYGDSLANLSPGTQVVNLVANFLGSSAREGKVVAQYIDGTEKDFADSNSYPTGPTGHIIGLIQPPASSSVSGEVPPPMIVIHDYMQGGWFNLMVFDGIDMLYVHPASGQILFNGAVNSGQLAAMAHNDGSGNDRLMHVRVPQSYRVSGGPSFPVAINNSAVEVIPEQDVFLGFLGPQSSSGLPVCYDATIANLSNLYWDANTDGSLQETGEFLEWDPGASVTSNFEISVVAGGNPYGTGVCTGGNFTSANAINGGASNPQTNLYFDHNAMANGNDHFMNISSPFVANSPGGSFIYSDPSPGMGSRWVMAAGTGTLTIEYGLLPGAAGPSALGGIEVYVKLGDSSFNGGYDGVNCNEVANKEDYELLHDELPSSSMLTGKSNSIVVAPYNDPSGKKLNIALCPYKRNIFGEKVFFPQFVHKDDLCSGNCP